MIIKKRSIAKIWSSESDQLQRYDHQKAIKGKRYNDQKAIKGKGMVIRKRSKENVW
jgi:hypothetical protein